MKIFQILLIPLVFKVINGMSYSMEYSNPIGYSDYFKSNGLNSWYSNPIGYSNYFNSNSFTNMGSYLFKSSYSHINSRNNILTNVVSVMPIISQSIILYSNENPYTCTYSQYIGSINNNPTGEPTQFPIIVPSAKSTIKPTAVPTVSPTNLPTIKPTAVPTVSPTKTNQIVPVISFESDIVFNNLAKSELDDLSKNLIILNCANIMNISKTFLKILQTDNKIKTSMSFAHLLGFNFLVKLQTTIPLLIYKTDPGTVYSLLTNKLAQSVSSGNFINQLQLLSSIQNISTFVNSSVLSITNGKYLVENSAEKSPQNPNIKSVISVIIITLVFAFVFLLGHWIKVHGIPKFNKNQGLRIDLNVINNPMGII